MARRRAQSPAQAATHAESPQRARAKKRGSDEDDAITDSQQMLALRPILKKPKSDDKEMQQFTTTVARNQRDLRALLQQRLRQAEKERVRRRDNLAAIMSEAFLPPSSDEGPPDDTYAKYPGTLIAVNPLFGSAADMINTSKGLVAEFDRYEAMTTNAQQQKQPITEKWQLEVRETERLLRLGQRTALRQVKKVLGVADGDEMKGVEGEGGKEDVHKGGELSDMPLNYELHKTLRYAERGVKRMVKGLPRDEML